MTSDRARLRAIAVAAMRARGLEPDFPADAVQQTAALHAPRPSDAAARDLRRLLWCSIENDDSRDLDQLSVAEPLAVTRPGLVPAAIAFAALEVVAILLFVAVILATWRRTGKPLAAHDGYILAAMGLVGCMMTLIVGGTTLLRG